MLGNQICGAASPLCRAVVVARTELVRRTGGVPPLSAAANGTGQRTATVVVGPKARALPCCPRPPWQSDNVRSCRFTHRWRRPEPERAHVAAADAAPPPPRPPNMCTETKWGKMLRLRSSKRGNAGRTERRLVSASAQSSAAAATPRACSRGLTCPARLRSGRRAGAAPPSAPPPASVARPARYMKATGFARTECTLPSLPRSSTSSSSLICTYPLARSGPTELLQPVMRSCSFAFFFVPLYRPSTYTFNMLRWQLPPTLRTSPNSQMVTQQNF